MQADTDVIRGNEFDAFMQPQVAAPNTAGTVPAGPGPSAGTRARAALDSSRSAAAPVAPAPNRKTMIAVGVVVLVAAVSVAYVWSSGALSSKPLPPEVAAVVAAAERPAPVTTPTATRQAAASSGDLPLPVESPAATEPSAPAATLAPAAAAPAAPVASSVPPPAPTAVATPAPASSPDLAATLESRERELALLRNALANERAARARVEQSGSRGTVTAVLRDGVVVRDASGNDRVVGVGQKVP